MGLSTGLQAIHNDDLHTGNAKRGVASGLATLDASSKVVQEPASKAVASGLATLDASSKVVQEPASKGLASGIAALDAGSKIAVSNLPVNVASGIAGLDASSRVSAAQLALSELIANKNAASGYAGLDASILLALTQQRLNFYIGGFSKDTADASGSQAFTGIGFRPRGVIFLSNIQATPEISIGFDDGTTKEVVSNFHNSVANTWLCLNSCSIIFYQTGSIVYSGRISSLDADGFTITWTKTGAKTGTASIWYLAFR